MLLFWVAFWLAGWLACCLAGWLEGWLAGCLVDWLDDWHLLLGRSFQGGGLLATEEFSCLTLYLYCIPTNQKPAFSLSRLTIQKLGLWMGKWGLLIGQPLYKSVSYIRPVPQFMLDHRRKSISIKIHAMHWSHLVALSGSRLEWWGGNFKLSTQYLNLSEPPGGDFLKYCAISKTKDPRI